MMRLGMRNVSTLAWGGVVILLLLWGGVTAKVNAKPQDDARVFLQAVQQGRLEQAKRILEDHKWRSGPPDWAGGDDAYFTYQSAFTPTLAFLVGHAFRMGPARVNGHYKAEMCLVPLSCSESVDLEIPIIFDKGYQPLLLPPALAFSGYGPMSLNALEQYIANPTVAKDDAFSLRLRPSLKRPITPKPTRYQVASPPPPPAPPSASAGRTSPITSLAAGSTEAGLIPRARQTGQGARSSGEAMSATTLEAKLPRLKSVSVRFYMSRHGQLAPWRISFFNLRNAMVQSGGKTHRFPLHDSDTP